MPQPQFLHIQSRARSAARVVALTGGTVRIGRAADCEARLDDPSLAEVEGLLRLQGEHWHIQPLSPRGRITIDGRTVTHLRALAPNVPMRVGDATLVLRDREAMPAGFGTIEVPAAPVASTYARYSSVVEDDRLGDRPRAEPRREAPNRPTPTATVPPATPSSASRRDAATRLWEARFRAAGRSLRARGATAAEPPAEPVAPEPAVIPFAPRIEPSPATGQETETERPTRDSDPSYGRGTFSYPGTPSDAPRLHGPELQAAAVEESAAYGPGEPRTIGAGNRLSVPENGDEDTSGQGPGTPHFHPAGSEVIGEVASAIPATTFPIERSGNFGGNGDPGPLESSIGNPESAFRTAPTEVPPPGCTEPEVLWAIPAASPEAILSAATELPLFAVESATIEARIDVPPMADPPEAAEPAAVAPVPVRPRRATSTNVPASRPSRSDLPRRGRPRPAAPPVPARELEPDEEWPSVRTILAARPADAPRPAPRPRKEKRRPIPTASAAPALWGLPIWLTWTVSLAATLTIGAVGLMLALAWSADDRDAGILADRLLKADANLKEPIAEAEINADATWWKTTGPHLALRAVALGMTRGGATRQESTRFLLDAARSVSPLEPASRLARADLASDDPKDPLATLGLSRDAMSLALTARTLARRGKTAPALETYRSALAIAARADVTRGRVPEFLDDATARRFALPSESFVVAIVREMASQKDWTPKLWADAIPDHGLVLLASYRVLKEKGEPEAEDALRRLVESGDTPSVGNAALHAAARAEGLALAGKAQEAEAIYAAAIAGMADPAIRRTWHLNRGVILARLGGDERDRATEAMDAARAGRGDDEIGKQVAQAMNREGMRTKGTPSPGQKLRAN